MLGVSNTKVLRILVEKCQHLPMPIRRVGAVNRQSRIADYFVEQHGTTEYDPDYKVWSNIMGENYDLEKSSTFGEVDNLFSNFDNVSYKCLQENVIEELVEESSENPVEDVPSNNNINAFSVLMLSSRKSQKRAFPSEKKGENNRKTELFNELLADFKSKKLDFPRATAETEGNYVIGVLCNALWYITNDHESIANRCKHVSGLIPVPKVYETYVCWL